jgi:hypothetical protein
MRQICTFALAAALGLASPLLMAEGANAQEAPPQNDSGIPPEYIGFGVLGAGVLAAVIIVIVTQNHHQQLPQVSP